MAPTSLSRRLSTLDAGFLYFERPGQPTHVGACLGYDGHISREQLVRTLEERLHLLPLYRQRVVFPPFGIAHPTWEDDPDFDLANHVEELTLPAPGDDRVLSEFGGRVFATLLDRQHPLWQLILLQGRPDGSTAILWKIHHAMVDGVSTVELMMVLHDLRPDAAPPPPPAAPWRPAPLPDPLTLLQDAVRDQLTAAAEQWTDDTFRQFRPAAAAEQARQLTSALTRPTPQLLQPAPPTPFNGPLSAERQFVWLELPFAEVRAIKGTLGGTVNDLVLAILAGGLGRYMRHHGYRTEGVELRAMCPVSMRRADERGAMGNRVTSVIVPLHVGISDPVERLRAERAAMDRIKEQDQASTLYTLAALADRLPPAWQALAAQSPVSTTLLNTVSSNVPGPQVPLYLAGRRLVRYVGLGICSANIGLFVGIISYHQQLTYGLLVDPRLVRDAWYLVDCLREAYDELRAAAERSQPAAFAALAAPPVPGGRSAGRGRPKAAAPR